MARWALSLWLTALLVALAAACGGDGAGVVVAVAVGDGAGEEVDTSVGTALGDGEGTPAPSATPTVTPTAVNPPRLELVVADADFPVALAVAPDGRLFYNELLSGRIRIVEDRELQAEPFASLEVQATGEHGLLGLAIDPNYSENRYVYAFYSVPAADGSPSSSGWYVSWRWVDGVLR